MNRFLQALANLFRIEDLRKRLLFTLAMLAVYRIGAHIFTPGINTALLDQLFEQGRGSVLDFFNLFSGGNFRRLTIFALGIMPYITASIILQLMTVVFPYLERLQKEGELGRRKITQYTRYLTIVLSIIQSLSIAYTLQAQSMNGQSLVYHPGLGFTVMTVITLTTGSAFIMWLGEQITERGIGNGMSLIIFVGIVVGLPRAIGDLYEKAKTGAWGPYTPLALILLLAIMLAVSGFIVFVEGGQRRIPVQYAKRVVGRRIMGGQMAYLPLRVNSGGVIPPIFASSLLAVWLITGIKLQHLWLVGSWIDAHFPRFILEGLNVNFYFGGTSLLIVVGVAVDTVQQLEAQLVMRNYDGFTRGRGRIRGRR